MWTRIAATLMFVAFASPAFAECDPNDPVTGLPDLSYSVVVWNAAAGGPATLLVVPDGSGPSFTQARRPDGTPVDATIELTLATPCGTVAHFPREDIWLESTGGNFVPCIGGTIADNNSDASGLMRWVLPLHAGGNSPGPCVVVINGAPLYTMTTLDLHFNSPDLNGDRVVSLNDVALFAARYFGAYAFAADLHADGHIDLADIPLLARSMGAHCP
ncbi:MAG: hypothetical protein IPH86_14535 [bacterium]|nr:hypothetical protein [bacterium]